MVKMNESGGFTKAKTRLDGRVFDSSRQSPPFAGLRRSEGLTYRPRTLASKAAAILCIGQSRIDTTGHRADVVAHQVVGAPRDDTNCSDDQSVLDHGLAPQSANQGLLDANYQSIDGCHSTLL